MWNFLKNLIELCKVSAVGLSSDLCDEYEEQEQLKAQEEKSFIVDPCGFPGDGKKPTASNQFET
ncbi:MAG: hypothetical protein Q7S87_03250 [Agitococcus sp.]|nr:hypothetical protein [Agitococcus sp.]MDO9178652.1 hypothetical protein [Agitococcus sp.]